MEAATHALGKRPSPLLLAHSQEELLPTVTNASLTDVVRLLVREHANAHVAIRIDGKAFYATATGIDGIAAGRCGLYFVFQIFLVL